ncbi:MAG TPA: hypothetical protein VFI47_18355 [Acidimicrobiales bacterium]|nr:hypothetical protein [Acidimicrobiales bacterium]
MECPEHGEVSAYKDLGRCYWSLKCAGARGEELTPEQYDHVGVYAPRPHERGWVDASTLGPSFEVTMPALEGPDADLHKALATPTHTEFLA